jgi:hypothetical protein
MKNILLLFVSVWILNSCTKESGLDKFPQTWKLTSMSGQMPNSSTSGSDMAWQETYRLNSNGTFTKSREQNGIIIEASGTFVFTNLTDGKYLELSYGSNSTIIGSCTPGLKETLWVRSESRMSGTWSYCDGPGLEYEKSK